jgi:eukaryotic-like serine/threonine-protein kinase
MGSAIGRDSKVADWSLIRQLGAGAQSQVWLARRGDDVVALKLQPLPGGPGQADAAQAFLHAAQLARGLRHPAIVAVWEAGIDGALAWLAMEPVPGSDLQRYTRAPRLLPEPVLRWLLQRVATGLEHAHAQGVVHRDLKPANVLVNWADSAVRIADFGLARAVGVSRTGTGIVPGTPAYSAPEQLAGAEPDARSDLYALGAMAFELLTGRLPHEAATMGELLRRVARDPVPDLAQLRPDITPALAALVARLLARSRAERPARAADVAAALTAIAPGQPIAQGAAPTAPTAAGRPSR